MIEPDLTNRQIASNRSIIEKPSVEDNKAISEFLKIRMYSFYGDNSD
jgi:hypothetical protein